MVSHHGSNNRSYALQRASLPSALWMFNIHDLTHGLFVRKYITYFESLIYFRTELLTRVKFSRHVWTGFCGPTRWWKVVPPQKFVNIYDHQKFWKCTSFWGFADIASVVRWFVWRCVAAWSVVRFLVRWIFWSLHCINFILWRNSRDPEKMQISIFLWFSEFRKIRIENFINSNYSNCSQKIRKIRIIRIFGRRDQQVERPFSHKKRRLVRESDIDL